jgi:hypothetical protein
MPQLGLPINRLVSVQVVLTAQGAQAPAINSLLILGTSDVIDTVQRLRVYSDLDDIAFDFGTAADEYGAAQAWFSQSPKPEQVYIGRWANTATAGQLVGGVLSTDEQLLSAWQSITTGAFAIKLDAAGTATQISGLNFSAAATLTAVAAIIDTAVVGAKVTWQAEGGYFVIKSDTSGATSAVAFLTAPASGTDISAKLKMLVTSPGAYTVAGKAAGSETALNAITIMEKGWGRLWYAAVVPAGVVADHQAVAAYLESTVSPHFYGVTTNDVNCLNSSNTTNPAYVLKAMGLNKTAVQYSSSNRYAVCSLLARILTTRWNGGNTAITLMWKQQPTILPEILIGQEADALMHNNCNVLAEYQNDVSIIQYGVCSGGQFIDTVIGADAMSLDIQTEVFNALYSNTSKIPQTDGGMTQLCLAAESACLRFVDNGYLAAGVWNTSGFGGLDTGEWLSKGYYVYAARISTQSAADRAARRAPLIQVAAKAAGAIHTADVLITVNNP